MTYNLENDNLCTQCNGSGEGMHDGSTCSSCKGSGVDPKDKDIDIDDLID
jgi:DnaJ-class molecular chaperone